ncbi:hypothetical protein FACS1894190_16620 [Spirochaetia bacterium]|nr:hypothetical protein FACS1894190_16620 [Spirochaetia bacterium]
MSGDIRKHYGHKYTMKITAVVFLIMLLTGMTIEIISGVIRRDTYRYEKQIYEADKKDGYVKTKSGIQVEVEISED